MGRVIPAGNAPGDLSNPLAPPALWRSPLVTSASPSGPNPAASTGVLPRPSPTLPRFTPRPTHPCCPNLLPAILVSAAAAAAAARGTLGIVVPAPEAPLSPRLRTSAEPKFSAAAGQKATFLLLVQACLGAPAAAVCCLSLDIPLEE